MTAALESLYGAFRETSDENELVGTKVTENSDHVARVFVKLCETRVYDVCLCLCMYVRASV